MELGSNVKKIRKRWGMDQEDFAQLFGLSRGAISMYETESSEPKLKWLLLFHEMTGIGLYALCTRDLTPEEIPKEPYPPGTKHESIVAAPEELQDIDQQVAQLKAIIQDLSSRIEKVEKSP